MAEAQKAAPEKSQESTEETKLPTCGIIMPISGIDGTCYTREHWKEVRGILEQAAVEAGFAPGMVSESEATAVIQGNIVNNVYYADIVVCDVSTRNPNVMFELGMRLAFDRPFVIVKDDATGYVFDIGMIQHIGYPCQLNYQTILDFIQELSKKLQATYENYKKNPSKHSFLQRFGDIKSQHLTDKDINIGKILADLTAKVDTIYDMGINNKHKNNESLGVNYSDIVTNMIYKTSLEQCRNLANARKERQKMLHDAMRRLKRQEDNSDE